MGTESGLSGWARTTTLLGTRVFLRGLTGSDRLWREVVDRRRRGNRARSKTAVTVGWATAELNVAGRDADRDRMTRLPSRGSSSEPLAELDQGLGQECACDERFGRLNSRAHAALTCSRVGWSSQPITIAATRYSRPRLGTT
jgi:hypothetical protein